MSFIISSFSLCNTFLPHHEGMFHLPRVLFSGTQSCADVLKANISPDKGSVYVRRAIISPDKSNVYVRKAIISPDKGSAYVHKALISPHKDGAYVRMAYISCEMPSAYKLRTSLTRLSFKKLYQP